LTIRRRKEKHRNK